MSDKNSVPIAGGCCGGKERQPAKKPCKNKACGSVKKTGGASEKGAKVWHCGYEATICPCNPCFCGKPIDAPRKMFP